MRPLRNIAALCLVIAGSFSLGAQSRSFTDSLRALLHTAKEDTVKVKLLNTLADATGMNDTALCLEYTREALDLADRLHYSSGIFRAFINYANIYQGTGFYEEAMHYTEKAEKVATRPQERSDLMKAKGNIYILQTKFREATAAYLSALRIADSLGDKESLASINANIAVVYLETEQYEQALHYATSALRLVPALRNKELTSDVYSNVANVYYYMERDDSALKYMNKTLALRMEIGNRQKVAMSYHNLGTFYFETGDRRKAEEYLVKGLQIREELNERSGLVASYRALANFYMRQKDFTKALTMLDKGLGYVQAIRSSLRLMDYYHTYSKVFAEMGNYQKAYDYHTLYEAAKDSVFNSEKHRQISDLRMRYETDKKEQQNLLLARDNSMKAAEIERGRWLRYILIASLCLLIVLLYLLFNNYRLKGRLHESELRQRVQKERERISRDLHDNVGSQLCIIRAGIEEMDASAALQASKLSGLREISQETLNTLRETIWALAEEHISYESFADKVKKYAALRHEALEHQVTEILAQPLDITLTPAEALNLYRIIQEAINNSLKHSGSDRVKVKLQRPEGKGRLLVEISDNGKGFDPGRQHTGYGIGSMRHRAAEIGAAIALVSAEGKGTCIRITV